MTAPDNHQPDGMDEIDKVLHDLWIVFYENSTLTGMSDTYYIAQIEARAAIERICQERVNTVLDKLLEEQTMVSRSEFTNLRMAEVKTTAFRAVPVAAIEAAKEGRNG